MANQKSDSKDTDIVCFAAQNQWVCAPKGEQEIAKKKAEKLIQSQPRPKPNVVITTMDKPSFSSSSQTRKPRPSPLDFFAIRPKKDPEQEEIDSSIENSEPSPPTDQNTPEPAKDPMQAIPEANKYAKLWSYQLIGVSSMQNAINYVYKLKLNRNDVLIVKTERNGSEWWVVLYKLYKDKATGVADMNKLPESIKQPWLRPLRNLKINAFLENY